MWAALSLTANFRFLSETVTCSHTLLLHKGSFYFLLHTYLAMFKLN